MRKLFFLIVLVAWACVGCAGPQLVGENPPNHMIYGGEKDFGYAFILMRQYDIVEGNETRTGYHYLSPHEDPVKIQEGTKELLLSAKILNPKKKDYTLWEKFKALHSNEKYPWEIKRQFYEGALSINEITMKLPTKGITEVNYCIEVRDASNALMYEIGPIRYTWAGGGGGDAR